MADETAVTDVVEEVVDYKALYEKAQEDLQIVAAKKEQLYRETKQAKKDREDQILKAEQEKAQKDGEFEKLWQSVDQQRAALQKELQDERNINRQEKIQSHAMKLAVELADGDALSAKLLAKFVQESISKMADERGSLDEAVLSAVKREFLNNTDYAPLLSGSKAKGGGALGSGNSVAKQNTVDRATYDTWSLGKQREFVTTGKGTVHD